MFPYALAVWIPGFHPGSPGSTPGMGTQLSQAGINKVYSTLLSSIMRFLLRDRGEACVAAP